MASIGVLLLLGGVRVMAQADQYLQVYSLIQDGDAIDSSVHPDQALAKYLEAQTALHRFQKAYPDWNTGVVEYRLEYLASKIAGISAKSSATASSPTTTSASKTSAPVTTPVAAAAIKNLQDRVANLQGQLRQLQGDKILLEAKLKEALTAQPAAVDPRELAKAQERIKTLEKENGLLHVSLDQKNEKSAMPSADTELVSRLKSQVAALQAGAAAAVALRTENNILKKQLAAAKAAPSSTKPSDMDRQLAEVTAQVAALQSDKEVLRRRNAVLESQIKRLSVVKPASSTTASSDQTARLKQLEIERATLEAKLASAEEELRGRRPSKSVSPQTADLNGQLETLRARLEVLEAKQVPYTAEELALLKKPAMPLATSPHRNAQRSVTELPAGAAKLVAEARADFAAQHFDQAEQKYLEVLKKDKNNVYTLANLATIQLQLGHLEEAEKHVRRALAQDPDDAYSLMVLGEIEFRQAKYDDALAALSRAAKLDPRNAEIQNYLGVTLSQKGLREPAETALRKAIEINPDYASAHNNLAVIYLSEKPPLVSLARWHYNKARAAGLPRNPELEKMLAQDQKLETAK